MERLATITLFPLIILNAFAGITGLIWLLILGEWKLVLIALVFYFFISWLLSFVLLIPMPFSYLGIHFLKKSNFLSSLFMFLGLLLTSVITSGWVLLVLSSVFINAQENGLSVVPLLLGGYALAVGPFMKMARGEDKDSVGTYLTVYITQITYIISTLFIIFKLNFLVIPVALLLALIADIYLLRLGHSIQKVENLS